MVSDNPAGTPVPTSLDVIDYVANEGGGIRFSAEVIRALRLRQPSLEVTLVSDGDALDRYVGALSDVPGVKFRRVPVWGAAALHRVRALRGGARLLRRAGFDAFHVVVPGHALRAEHVAWFPWVHRHRLLGGTRKSIVGSFHDAIMLERSDIVPQDARMDELETTRRWLGSRHSVVVSSRATVASLRRLSLLDDDARCTVIPVAADHMARVQARPEVPSWPWLARPFLLCPANVMPHKNHEALFAGLARARAGMPLVLTGTGADLADPGRGAALRAHAWTLGLRRDDDLIPLGYLDDATYRTVLERAHALIMPTLAEGGGSFPVLEAMVAGVPVLCSRIPVLEEQLERTGGIVSWFAPSDPDDLAQTLRAVLANHAVHKAQAEAQRENLRVRRWAEVADDYFSLFRAASRRD